mmetsp:Transcript_13804/g.60270  ORF Transcript_13804/g.60270 Transcript_13804/m.60270 type:complete len:315 (-) Transcript_13804:592-1536(-)
MCDTASLSALGGAEAQSADIAAAAGRMDGDAAAMFAPPDKNDALLPATLAPCGGDRRCSGDGGGMPPTCVRASRSIPIPPTSPADALRFIGDIGVVGTLHCSFVLPESLGVRASPPDFAPEPDSLARLALCSLLRATLSRCAADPPTISRAATCTPSRTPLTHPPSHVHPASGTLTTNTHSSFAAFASMISTCAMSGQSPSASRLNLMTVKRYWSSLPYLLRSRLVEYSFPSSSASWCRRSSSGTRCVPVDSATTFVRRVLTERSLRTLRPPSRRESSAVWIALSTWRKADVTDAHPWVSSGRVSRTPGIIGYG